MSSSSSCHGTGPFTFATVQSSASSLQATAAADIGQSASASGGLQETVPFTVTSGPAQGFYIPCVYVEQDWFQGGASAFASLGSASVFGIGQGTFGSCGVAQSFTLGVTQFLPVSLSVSANAGSRYFDAQAGARAGLSGFRFVDEFGTTVSGVTYTIGEVPEPAPATLCLGAAILLALAWVRRRMIV